MKRFFFIIAGVLLIIPSVSAEELILEFDPDEEIRSSFEVRIPEVNSEPVVSEENEATLSREDAYIEGYKQLFEWTESELAGLEQIYGKSQEERTSIDAQIKLIDLQRDRVLQQQQQVREKVRGLNEIKNRYLIQEKLLSLEMKGLLQKFDRLMEMSFRVERQFVDESGELNISQLFSSADEPSEVLFQHYLLKSIQQQLIDEMEQLQGVRQQLDKLQEQLSIIVLQNKAYDERLQRSADVLADQAAYQSELLSFKQDEAAFFDREIKAARQEQMLIAQRIRELALGVPTGPYSNLPMEEMLWPVQPVLGVSAEFHDEGYHQRFGIEHNAVDVPTDQLTPVKAALSGKVVKVKDGGEKGYSYIQIAHREGLSTVYGHMFSFKVAEGQTVQRGQVIGLSGGAIGTRGAGRLTTGPHLHFEVLKEGKHVNPRLYLPSQR